MSHGLDTALTKLRDRLYIPIISGVFLFYKTERDLKTFFFHCGNRTVTLTYQKGTVSLPKATYLYPLINWNLKQKI